MATLRWMTTLVLALGIGVGAASAWAQPKDRPKPRAERVTIDFDDAPLRNVVAFYSKLLNRNFIMTDSLQGKRITVLAPNAVTVAEAWDLFVVTLQMNGLTAVQAGGYIRIMPASEGPSTAPIRIDRAPGPARADIPAGMELEVVELYDADSATMAGILEKLASKDARIVSEPRTNTVIIVEHPDNLRRLVALARKLDRAEPTEKIRVVPIENQDAADMAKILDAAGLRKD